MTAPEGERTRSVCILLQNTYDGDIRVRRKAEALVAAGYSVDVLALRSSQSNKRYTLKGVQVFSAACRDLERPVSPELVAFRRREQTRRWHTFLTSPYRRGSELGARS